MRVEPFHALLATGLPLVIGAFFLSRGFSTFSLLDSPRTALGFKLFFMAAVSRSSSQQLIYNAFAEAAPSCRQPLTATRQ